VSIFPFELCTTCHTLCVCGDEERALRRIAGEDWPHGAMLPSQREWCAREADSAGEGTYKYEELILLPDSELARMVLHAWAEYVRSNCL